MSNNPETIYNQTYTCSGCHKKCNFSIKKQHATFYRPAVNDKIIYDYQLPTSFYDRHDTLCFTPETALEFVQFFIKFCTNAHRKR